MIKSDSIHVRSCVVRVELGTTYHCSIAADGTPAPAIDISQSMSYIMSNMIGGMFRRGLESRVTCQVLI
jgi:hypothetical protein